MKARPRGQASMSRLPSCYRGSHGSGTDHLEALEHPVVCGGHRRGKVKTGIHCTSLLSAGLADEMFVLELDHNLQKSLGHVAH